MKWYKLYLTNLLPYLAVILLLIVLIVHFIRHGIRKRRAKKG